MRVVSAGILVADVFVPPLEDLPAAGELRATDDFLLFPGGCAANTALTLARQGVPATVAGRVGDDLFADFLERDLTERGIDTSAVRRSSGSGTSKTVVLTVAGEDRRFIHTFGANADLSGADLPAPVGADVVYLGGYLVLPGLAQRELAAWFAEARAAGARTVLDVVVPAERERLSLGAVADVLPHVDFFIPNRDEAAALTGEAEPERQAHRLLDAGATTVVITMGAAGAVAADGERELGLPAPRVDVVDQSGAGDAFAGGLITGLVEGWELERSLRYACVLGASATTRLGCTAGVFTREQAEAYLEAHPLAAR